MERQSVLFYHSSPYDLPSACSEMAAQAALDTQKARSVRAAQQRGDFESLLAGGEGSATAGKL